MDMHAYIETHTGCMWAMCTRWLIVLQSIRGVQLIGGRDEEAMGVRFKSGSIRQRKAGGERYRYGENIGWAHFLSWDRVGATAYEHSMRSGRAATDGRVGVCKIRLAFLRSHRFALQPDVAGTADVVVQGWRAHMHTHTHTDLGGTAHTLRRY